MAGEDPGTGTLSVVLDLIQRTSSAVTNMFKSGINFGVDMAKTFMYLSLRRQMMKGQRGPDLEYGKQSLKKLRLHEQTGAEIVSVEIGDKKAMKALDAELKRLEIDYAITDSGGRDKVYTLHYKRASERDVMTAQAKAMQQLYGEQTQAQAAPGIEQAEQSEQANQSNQIDSENAERTDREAAERQQQEQQQQVQQQAQAQQQELDRQQQQTATAPGQVQPEGTDHERGRADQRESIGAEKAGRTMSHAAMAYGAAKSVPVDELQRKLQELKARKNDGRAAPQQGERVLAQSPEGRSSQDRSAPSLPKDVSVDEIKQRAAERAKSRNLARRQRKQDRNLGRSMSRSRSRGLELGH